MDNFILILKSIIMGIVEGVTEFLPISSTGHMILVGKSIGFDDTFATFFEVFIQFGAILAIVVLYRKKIIDSLRHLRRGEYGFKLWTAIIMAAIPTSIIAVIFHKTVKTYLWNVKSVALALVVGGIFMIVTENIFRKNNNTKRAEDTSLKQGFLIGVFQCLSVLWPGFSRSASTIIGGWAVGLTTVAAAEFSFFLAIPMMFAASVGEMVGERPAMSGIQILALIVGFVVSFLVALIVVKKFIEYLKTKPMRVFAIYRIIIGVLILLIAFNTNFLNLTV